MQLNWISGGCPQGCEDKRKIRNTEIRRITEVDEIVTWVIAKR